jgi:K+-sensing histidine kinase KdpD
VKDPVSPEFLAALCHDLRGPLGAMSNWLQVIGSESASPETRARALTLITGDVRAMSALVGQLSDLGAALSNETASLIAIDLLPFLKSVVQAAAEGAAPALDVSGPSCMALADPVRLRQMIWPLVTPSDKGSVPARKLEIRADVEVVEIGIECGHPRPLSVALARALAQSQGGELREISKDGVTTLGVRLRRAV